MAKTRQQLSDADRAARRRQDRERLRRAARELLDSEGWQRWVRVRSQAGPARLCLLIQPIPRGDGAAGRDVSHRLQELARLGYAVKKGEKAIRIIAPLPVSERDRITGEETGETLLLFKTVFVFDRAQVAPRRRPCSRPASR
jgi:hypothetical protein